MSVRALTHIGTQSVSSLAFQHHPPVLIGHSVIPASVPSPMCADAQTANLLRRKLIRSRSFRRVSHPKADLEVASQGAVTGDGSSTTGSASACDHSAIKPEIVLVYNLVSPRRTV